jgi:hypothetical protein
MKTVKVLLINALSLSLFGLGAIYGIVQPLFINDVSHVSFLMMGMMTIVVCMSVAAATRNIGYWGSAESRWSRYMEFIAPKFLFVGIIGTLIGLASAVAHLGVADLSDITKAIPFVLQSLKTLFNTTILGIVCYIWTETLLFAITTEE